MAAISVQAIWRGFFLRTCAQDVVDDRFASEQVAALVDEEEEEEGAEPPPSKLLAVPASFQQPRPPSQGQRGSRGSSRGGPRVSEARQRTQASARRHERIRRLSRGIHHERSAPSAPLSAPLSDPH